MRTPPFFKEILQESCCCCFLKSRKLLENVDFLCELLYVKSLSDVWMLLILNTLFYGSARIPFYSFRWVFKTQWNLIKSRMPGKWACPGQKSAGSLRNVWPEGCVPSMHIWPWLLAQKRWKPWNGTRYLPCAKFRATLTVFLLYNNVQKYLRISPHGITE